MSKKAISLLSLILLFGLFLRFYKFGETLNLDTDQAAAFLLADRIINHGHILLVGPFTSLWQVNLLSPTYYYIITFFYFLFRNEISVSLVFAFIGWLSIILIFIFTRKMFDIKTGLLASFMYAISQTMVNYSRNIWEPHLVPFFVLLALYLLYFAEGRKKALFIILPITSFFMSLMYVSSYLLLPSFFILSYLTYRNIHSKNKRPFIKIVFLFLFFFVIFYSPVFIFELKHNFPSFAYLLKVLQGQTSYISYNFPNFFFSNYVHSFLFFKSIFVSSNVYLFILFVLYLFLATLSFAFHKNQPKKEILILFIMISTVFLLTSFYQEKPEVYRLACLYPIFFILFAYLLSASVNSASKRNWRDCIFGALGFFFIIFFLNNNISALKAIVQASGMKNYIKPFNVAKHILSSAKGESFSVYTITPWEKWNHHSTSYLYALEKITGRKQTELNDRGNWINQDLNKNVKWIYLICRDFKNLSQIREGCLDYFIKREDLDEPEKENTTETVAIYKIKSKYEKI